MTPRFSEPLAAALMGAGFFIFVSVLTGAPLYRDMEEVLWRRFQGEASVAPAQAILIKGRGHESLSPAQRRMALARDLELLGASGARAILLEAWLDEASQAESEELLADLLDSVKALPKKSAQSMQDKVAGLKGRLNADETLASAILKAGMVVLPVGAESAPAMSPVSGTVWEKAHPYEVVVRGKGARRLDAAWRLVRAPYAGFREACMGLALVSPPLPETPDSPLELPAIFQVRGRWVNGMGFEAARLAMELPAKGLHFLWREGRLSAVEMRGSRFPVTPRGGLCLPPLHDRALVEELPLDTLENAPILKSLRGRVVFYQPWPGLLTGEEAFVQQRQLCAGLLSGRVQVSGENAPDLWLALAFAALCALSLVMISSDWVWMLPPLIAAGEFWRFLQIQVSLSGPWGLLLGGVLCGWGLRMLALKRARDSKRLWLRSHVASEAQSLWERLLPDPGAENSVAGVYVALHADEAIPSKLWTRWSARFSAFSEGFDAKDLGFLIPMGAAQAFPLLAIEELRRLLPNARIAALRGVFGMTAEKVFDSVRWSLSGDPKSEALAMLSLARPGAFLVLESDYSEIRQNVKIQLIGVSVLRPGSQASKIFNIIGVF